MDSSEEDDELEADELGLRLDGYCGKMKGGGVPVGRAEGGSGDEGKAIQKMQYKFWLFRKWLNKSIEMYVPLT